MLSIIRAQPPAPLQGVSHGGPGTAPLGFEKGSEAKAWVGVGGGGEVSAY